MASSASLPLGARPRLPQHDFCDGVRARTSRHRPTSRSRNDSSNSGSVSAASVDPRGGAARSAVGRQDPRSRSLRRVQRCVASALASSPATRGTFDRNAVDYLVHDIILYHLRYEAARDHSHTCPGRHRPVGRHLGAAPSARIDEGAVGEVDFYAAGDRIVLQDLAHPFSVWTDDAEVIGVIVPRA